MFVIAICCAFLLSPSSCYRRLASLGVGILHQETGETLVALNTDKLLLTEEFHSITLCRKHSPIILILNKDGKLGAAILHSRQSVDWRIPCAYDMYEQINGHFLFCNKKKAVFYGGFYYGKKKSHSRRNSRCRKIPTPAYLSMMFFLDKV